MILLIDNYDSFSYNLYQLIGTINPDIKVVRNDVVSINEIRTMDPEAIILSPGPGHPHEAGICVDVARALGNAFPILGVCLGHQAICEAYGAKVSYAKQLMHGKQSDCKIDESSKIFKGLDGKLKVARYHSLAVYRDTLPKDIKVIAETGDGEVMAIEHEKYPVFGLQFHPESILTPDGMDIIRNFLNISKI